MASRKCKPLSIKDKLNILAAVDRNPKRKQIDIANKLGLPASTVNTVVSKRKEIKTNAMVFSGATKQARGARHGELEEALLNYGSADQVQHQEQIWEASEAIAIGELQKASRNDSGQ
ncbi:hypothetical protein HPB49_013538 [Dermacentor silvarum]|uniref:Uncharacterized protein n=1 Tax=Dermacentor silvarum TaxID=543639 RepID=A0ACB8D5K4_DERSI|nr:hypothetical protein HPB49_013538 [Dermacentor silvarum]